MENTQKNAIERYAKNMEFFSQKHPNLFHKLSLFEEAIKSGQHQEKYALEYKEKYFDILELSSKNFLYNQNSIKFSEKLTAQVNLSKSSYIFEGFMLFKNYEQHKENFDDKTEGAEGVFPIMSYYLQNTPQTPEFKEIEKFIFIGVGLGVHIPQIAKKIKAEEYFVIEDDLELFRLSLFTTPYYRVRGNFYFSLAESKDAFLQSFKNFLENSFFRNRYLKYSYFPAHSKEKINFIKTALASQAFSSFPYKTFLKKTLHPLKFIAQNYHFVNFAKEFDASSINTKPVLMLAAGPSFEKNIAWIKKYHNCFIVVAVSAVLNKLYQEAIIPDIVTHLDGFKLSIKHLEGFDTKTFLKNTILIAGSFTPQEVVEKFTKENVFVYEEDDTAYHDGFNAIAAPCVGSTTLLLLLRMHMEQIYTIGLDLALDKDGHTHSSSHTLSNTTQYNLNQTQEENISMRGVFFEVAGNFDKSVITNPLFYTSIHALNNTLPIIKNETQSLYNIGNGAAIKTMLPTLIESVKISTESLNKQNIFQEISTLLKKYSKIKLTTEDKKSLKNRCKFALAIQDNIQIFANKKFTNSNQFLHSFITLLLEILIEPSRDTHNLISIYDRFLGYSAPLVFDFFNTKNLTNTQEHIYKFQNLLTVEMYEIVKIYIRDIEKFLVQVD